MRGVMQSLEQTNVVISYHKGKVYIEFRRQHTDELITRLALEYASYVNYLNILNDTRERVIIQHIHYLRSLGQ